jgi:hypothetical protein
VRDQNQCRPGAAVQLEHDLDDGSARFRIEITRGLIGEKNFGAIDEGAGERNPLLFAAGKLPGIMRHPFSQTDPLQ